MIPTETKLIQIIGMVIPVDWDADGNVLAAAIATSDESEYRIADGEQGRELLRLMHQTVRVSGNVKEEKGKETIDVKQYSLQKKGRRQSI